MMNDAQRQHALDVAEAIEQHADQFRQDQWRHTCGTPACIAGWSCALRRDLNQPSQVNLNDYDGSDISWDAGEALGLTRREASNMFHPEPYGEFEERPTAAEAVSVPPDLRRDRGGALARERRATVNEEQRLHALAVADAIEAHADQYFQGEWGHEPCGTPACIAGWSVALQEAPDDPAMFDLGGLGGDTIPNMAGEALGLSQEEADAIVRWLSLLVGLLPHGCGSRRHAAPLRGHGRGALAREGVTCPGAAVRGSNRGSSGPREREGCMSFRLRTP